MVSGWSVLTRSWNGWTDISAGTVKTELLPQRFYCRRYKVESLFFALLQNLIVFLIIPAITIHHPNQAIRPQNNLGIFFLLN